uniref:uncharacterized protein LOC122598798 isoform X2 n=1 Tax=Erigeron canadensis TaxID=72917 RepID=UPI001CB8F35A|nr:uncharacterized protein LOC122598798 isoform X2 [Erigeron canadensis]
MYKITVPNSFCTSPRTLNYPMAWHKRCGRGSPACYTFGQDIASQFNHMNGLVLISRSRQNCHGGFQLVPACPCYIENYGSCFNIVSYNDRPYFLNFSAVLFAHHCDGKMSQKIYSKQ